MKRTAQDEFLHVDVNEVVKRNRKEEREKMLEGLEASEIKDTDKALKEQAMNNCDSEFDKTEFLDTEIHAAVENAQNKVYEINEAEIEKKKQGSHG